MGNTDFTTRNSLETVVNLSIRLLILFKSNFNVFQSDYHLDKTTSELHYHPPYW